MGAFTSKRDMLTNCSRPLEPLILLKALLFSQLSSPLYTETPSSKAITMPPEGKNTPAQGRLPFRQSESALAEQKGFHLKPIHFQST